jgi:hypothetical protein
MATKDHENFYAGLDVAPPPNTVPNTVSRSLKVGDRAFQTIVTQSGKAVLDSEYQLIQDADQHAKSILNRHQAPSGWLRGQTRHDGYDDYGTETAPAINDDSGGVHIDGTTLVNAFVLPRLVAQVAGMPIVVEYTNTRDAGYNLITLEEATVYDGGSPATFKRTDFVFLEVWKALVAPSVASKGSVTVVDFSTIVALDTITIDGHALTAVAGAPAADQFQIGASNDATATNIAAAINLSTNWWFVNNSVKAKAFGSVVMIYAIIPGVAGDAILLALSNPGPITVSGPNLTGGADRPNKPNQTQVYRHGNVLSPSQVWLDDDLIDPAVNRETTQRVQIQYRIRSTGPAEALNYKTNPDGFSTTTGGPPVQSILAWGGIGSNVTDYPFVRADRTSATLNSSAVAYDVEDPGLWIAGDGTQTAAQDLNSVDGFVYAIPICFVHRHNDASSPLAGLLGFGPDDNTNGAPLHDHGGYAGVLGAIPATLSDRPDGAFADVINQNNLLDLRRHIIFPGIDTSAELQFQIQSLLDGSLRTWSVDAADKQELGNGSGDVSTRFLVCNEIGRTVAHGGSPGDGTTRGDFIREFDHIARRFGDQAVVERFVMAFYPGDRAVGPAVAPGLVNAGKYVTKAAFGTSSTWGEDDTLTLDLAALDATTLGTLFQGLSGDGTSTGGLPIFVADLIPVGTKITDVLTIRHDDGNSVAAIDQNVQVKTILGLGTTAIKITLDDNTLVADGGNASGPWPLVNSAALAGSNRRIFVEFELTYPIGKGATDTVYIPLNPDTVVYDPDTIPGVGPGPMVAEDAAQIPSDMEVSVGLRLPPKFREGYREIQLEYVANGTVAHAAPTPTTRIVDSVVSQDNQTLYFPRRVYFSRDALVTDTLVAAPVAIDDANTEWGSSSRMVKTTGLISADQALCDIEYYAQDAVPNYGPDGYQVGVYFRTHAPQTAGVSDLPPGTGEGGVLPTTLRVEPLYVAPDVWTNQVGSGSQDRGFPYLAPMDQIPINDGIAPSTYEWYLCATADVTVDDFNADTGIIALRPFVQADGQNVQVFGSVDADKKPRKDMDFRAYYPWANDAMYRMTVLSQPMFGAVRHKVLFPFLARATETVAGVDGGVLYRKDEVLLIVVSRFAELDAENNVRFTDPVADNRTCAALYRTRNLLLLVGDRVTFP